MPLMYKPGGFGVDTLPLEQKGDCERCLNSDCKDNVTPDEIIEEGRVLLMDCGCFEIDPDKVPL